MKFCPTCRSQYTDETLRYCLQDGAELVERLASDTPTVAFAESETVVRRGDDSQVTSWHVEEQTRVARKESRRPTGVIVALAGAIVVLAVVIIGGSAGLLVYLNSGKDVGTNNTNANTNISSFTNSNRVFPTPFPTIEANRANVNVPLPTPSAKPEPTSTVPPHDPSQTRQDIAGKIMAWKSLAESRNLMAYMNHYAETVDYYRRAGASRAFVQADKARAFRMYTSIRVNISNMSVSVDPDGARARAVFDKEWDFRGTSNSSGKVRSQLTFRNFGGTWLITGERDLRVYYTR